MRDARHDTIMKMKIGVLQSAARRYRVGISMMTIFAVGIGIGYLIPGQSPVDTVMHDEKRDTSSGYHFISPLLACKSDSETGISNKTAVEMRADIQSYLSQQVQVGTISRASVYFRELDDGASFIINPSYTFNLGSLLKVPLVMSVYTHAEKNPGFLDEKVTYGGGSYNGEEYYPPPVSIEVGKTYTIEQLVEATLRYSDNNAAILLSQTIPQGEFDDTYSELGIDPPPYGGSYVLNNQGYAIFFRVLYNATFLNHDDSEHMLQLLSESTFDKGLAAGLPAGVTVAHKFGEQANADGSAPELHDCGIVYDQGAPYLLCVMTQGSSFDQDASVIARISQIAYSYEKP